MKVDVLNMEGKKVKQVELPAAIFEAPINMVQSRIVAMSFCEPRS